jgi:hypothetical protein
MAKNKPANRIPELPPDVSSNRSLYEKESREAEAILAQWRKRSADEKKTQSKPPASRKLR